jgi:hypothetical protein
VNKTGDGSRSFEVHLVRPVFVGSPKKIASDRRGLFVGSAFARKIEDRRRKFAGFPGFSHIMTAKKALDGTSTLVIPD